MKKQLLLTVVFGMFAIGLIAQNSSPRKRCHTTEHTAWLQSQNPNLKSQYENDEVKLQQWLQNYAVSRSANSNSVIVIPVVVHVVYRTAAQNISDAQILSQIDALNEDFARMNADTNNTPVAFRAAASATQFQFCLAKRDPSGMTTNGIERRQTTVTSFSTNDNVKFFASGGLDAWDVENYFNIWVCNMSGGILGYGEFPATVHTNTYGVVINYDSFGRVGNVSYPFDEGRTLTHEIGHCFRLFHIWGDDNGLCSGTDNIADTPNQSEETYGCLTFPHTDNCTTTGNGIMFMNYMDYSNDACLNMFTSNQATRMFVSLNGYYPSLTTSVACDDIIKNVESINELQFSIYPNPTDGILNIDMSTSQNTGEIMNVRVTDAIGKIVAEQEIGIPNGRVHQMDLSDLESGSYFVTVYSLSYKRTVQFVKNN
jgi:Pregnancy-associated plasma protein-A/Secretion system C-terminal sorting domain